jgi:uncharacterized lipoprotein YmbA
MLDAVAIEDAPRGQVCGPCGQRQRLTEATPVEGFHGTPQTDVVVQILAQLDQQSGQLVKLSLG